MATVQEHILHVAQALRDKAEPAITAPALLDTKACHDILVAADDDTDWETVLTERSAVIQKDTLQFLSQNQPLVYRDEDGAQVAVHDEIEQLNDDIAEFSQLRVLEKSDGPSERICIGRAKKNDVLVVHKSISSIHAQIEVGDENFFLFDSNSSNGTFVNEERLQPRNARLLTSGDLVRLGDLTFYYLAKDSVRLFLKFRLANMLATS